MAALAKVRAFELKSGQVTQNVLSFQYYPNVVFNPKLNPFAEEMRRQLKCGNRMWIYCHDAATNKLNLIYPSSLPTREADFCRNIKSGYIRVFVETEKPLEGSELVFEIPELPGIEGVERSTDDYTKFIKYLTNVRETVESIVKGTELFATYVDITMNGPNASHTGMVCRRCGDPVQSVLEKCVVCDHVACASCAPLLDHQRVHRCKTIHIAYPNGFYQADAPRCVKCRERVSPLYFIDKRTFEPVCNEDGETMIATGDASKHDLFLMHSGPIFKYQDLFLELKKEFPGVKDERIKLLLYLNKGNIISTKEALLVPNKTLRRCMNV